MYKILAVLVIYVLSIQNIFAKSDNDYGFTHTSPNIEDKPINQPLKIIPIEPQRIEPQSNVAPDIAKTTQKTKAKKSSSKTSSKEKQKTNSVNKTPSKKVKQSKDTNSKDNSIYEKKSGAVIKQAEPNTNVEQPQELNTNIATQEQEIGKTEESKDDNNDSTAQEVIQEPNLSNNTQKQSITNEDNDIDSTMPSATTNTYSGDSSTNTATSEPAPYVNPYIKSSPNSSSKGDSKNNNKESYID
jgi:hypothetical protein